MKLLSVTLTISTYDGSELSEEELDDKHGAKFPGDRPKESGHFDKVIFWAYM